MPFFFWDPTMIIVLPALALAIYAQFKVRSAYNKYSEVESSSYRTGAEIARAILDSNGLYDVRVEETPGTLTDHYDPRDKTVRLSSGNYYGRSLAAAAIAAHECGHALQDAQDYSFLRFRHSLFPVANIGSMAAFPLFLAGFFFGPKLMLLGILLFTAALLFQVVTLPVEFNASSRAMSQMVSLGILRNVEERGARKVLNAAALTYVAGALMSALELVRLLLIFNSQEE
ncbi:zinc metallopeptidase [Microaerobacter geothermalis]|uniref:zinc metallopeptidase n=1 Tax=Microaerobacter geothermalis TaxID=674972 RepID=UPI001F31FFDF|nr:zinc metallopeptidase [Microaerobacter geothermalis]MCF6093359.1 zinc metallopeptidase [Microaerobacter geothermalis]